MNVIYTKELVKVYNRWAKHPIKALDGVTIEVEEGKIFALLGPNGAGKSTLIKILLKLVKPTSGTIYILNDSLNSSNSRTTIGYLPEFFQVPKYFTAFSLLKYLGELSGLSGKSLKKRIEEVLEIVNLTDSISKKAGSFSKGMIQRLGIAQAILHNPNLLILDEPTDGLDPIGRKIVRELLIKLRNEGKSIFLNSHLLSEVELIADQIAILNKGRVIVQGSLMDILPSHQQFEIYLLTKPALEGDWNISQSGIGWKITIQGSKQLQKILAILESKNIPVDSVKPLQTTLEDVFFSYINSEESL
jgi:ABC-2 type transport system ATP-binding protein